MNFGIYYKMLIVLIAGLLMIVTSYVMGIEDGINDEESSATQQGNYNNKFNKTSLPDNNLEQEFLMESSSSEEKTLIKEEPEEEVIENTSADPETYSPELYLHVTDSPEIYFHVEDKVKVDITVEIKDGVTKTIPEIQLGNKVTWENLLIDKNGVINYNDNEYEFLYYEGRFHYAPSNYGWLVTKIDEQLFLNDNLVTEQELLEFIKIQMRDSGLHENEIEFLIDRITQNKMLDFSSKYLLIRYIPQADVDEAIKIQSDLNFNIIRRHFLIEAVDNHVEMNDPIYEIIEDSGFLIHETAVNRH
ncbi:MAG: hypothetical protein JSV49_10820 [Thermoplasmata archaeon]|nr:MAG: hypothetical protein JSV49_10820 [Thermoplasmata archaeon]